MFGRHDLTIGWQYVNELGIGATFFVDVGGWDSNFRPAGGPVPAGQFCAPINGLSFFTIDVYTDDDVEIDIQTGYGTLFMDTLVTLVCMGPAGHNTVYNLPPPFNRDGFLVLCSNFVRLQVRNTSGNVVMPFFLQARVYK